MHSISQFGFESSTQLPNKHGGQNNMGVVKNGKNLELKHFKEFNSSELLLLKN